MAWPGPAGIVAALALRAWIEVFSSAHTMIWPWRLNPWARSYKSKMGMAFSRKRGSVGCCQLQYCHGLIWSAASQRFTVEAEMFATIPRWITARASSLADQRDSGLPESRGKVQARAVTRARTAEGKKARPARPRGFLVCRPARLRLRHLRTVRSVQPTARAMATLLHSGCS